MMICLVYRAITTQKTQITGSHRGGSVLELTGRKASAKILKISYECQEFAQVCLQNVFSGLFTPRGKTALTGANSFL